MNQDRVVSPNEWAGIERVLKPGARDSLMTEVLSLHQRMSDEIEHDLAQAWERERELKKD